MSSLLQQPTQKRPRCESNNNVNSQNYNCNTSNINLLSLPDEALNNIISYSLPQRECQIWEWIGILNQTCRSLRRFAQTYVPTNIELKDFECYTHLNSGSDRSIDVRIGFLQSLHDASWKRQHLKEFHVDWSSVLRWTREQEEETRLRSRVACNDIRVLLRTLLTTPSSFPELEWLDIELQSDHIYGYELVDVESLRLMPEALPDIQKLSLSECFKRGHREVSPYRLKRFFTNLQTSLTSLSICGTQWMTDAHVEAIMPMIGESLVRLEFVNCSRWDNEEEIEEKLSDSSLVCIAQHCKQLKSFSMVSSHITSRGLEMVLRANTGITTLNLSENGRLDTGTVDIISRYLPRLEVLRNYWSDIPDWLNDNGLIALVDAQERESGGSGIFLKLLGLNNSHLTVRGVKHAIDKGLREIEIDESVLYNSIVDLGSSVELYQAQYPHYIDGSQYESMAVFW